MQEFYSLNHVLRTGLSLLAVLALASIALRCFAPFLRRREQQSNPRGKKAQAGSATPSTETPLRLIQKLELSADTCLFLIEDEGGTREVFSLDRHGLRLVENTVLAMHAIPSLDELRRSDPQNFKLSLVKNNRAPE